MGWQDAPVVGQSWQDAPLVDEKRGKPRLSDQQAQVYNAVMSSAPFGAYSTDIAMGAKQALDAAAQFAARSTGLGVKQTEAANQASKDAYDATRPDTRPGSSFVRGAAPALALSRVIPGSSGGVLQSMGIGAGAGAAGGALEPVYNATSDADYFNQKKGQLLRGAVTGGGLGGAFSVAGKTIAPTLDAGQQVLAKAGIRMTPGQLSGGWLKGIEDRLAGYPIIGDLINNARSGGIEDFNKALYAKALEPFGAEGAAVVKQAPVGRQGVAAVGDFLSGKYEEALAKSVPTPMTPEFQQGMAKLSSMVPESFRKDFTNAINNNITLTPAGTITPSVARAADSELGRLVGQYKGSSVASEREYARALAQAQAQLRDAVAGANPAIAPITEAANKGWATLVQIENAAASVGSKNGVISPAQFLNAGVKRSDKSIRDRNFARGNALNQDIADAAKGVLPSTVPDSGTTGRAALGAAAAAGPAGLLGMFGSPLGAMATGAAALPYLPVVGPAINAARISAPAQMAGRTMRKMAPYLGLLGAYGP